MTALLDTGFLLAVLDEDDDLHQACVDVLLAEPRPILPDVVLPELAFMVIRELGYAPLITFLRSVLDGELPVEITLPADLERSIEIMGKYRDSRIDFVDTVIAAMAERLEIRTILTVDRRHFQIFRPKILGHFVVLP